jgi:hypothetical protein
MPVQLPQEVYNLVEFLSGPTQQAALYAASDFVAGTNKPWAYYLGVVTGLAVGTVGAATGIPGAAAIAYVAGDMVKTAILKSPEGGIVDVFLNGVANSSIDAYAASAVWEGVEIPLPGAGSRVNIQFRNRPNEGRSWMGIGGMEVVGGEAERKPGIALATFTIRDNKGQRSRFQLYMNSSDMYTMRRAVRKVCEKLGVLSEGKLERATITVDADISSLPGVSSYPLESADVENTIQIRLFNTQGQRRVISVPAGTDVWFDENGGFRPGIDSAPDLVAAFETMIGSPWSDNRGVAIVGYDAKQVFRRSRPGRR